ncbi:unnamed protein product [Musa acuminata subsp. malaccensis]|uniref:(wild Malaysian banana) hypothetical protein n=1 Tax=Musa acuminata subsp. malaccensis TaxID=214687 RepID=A0A804JQG4_MUSAM|nr:PREDICTED: uncharacterized protein LOC103991031 isoform X1 [Musa acuminata subsp. malaccensis]CAG1855179.1 unnamed protein product [Musa acuminata subsp. malaccensis]
MSKKKSSFSGSTTMTLKDFHGGSIPSQLPLPSAPSASASASARQSDRPGAWGTITAVASGRSDYHHHLLRPRPGSAGAASSSARGLDERPPALLPHSTPNGGHFDEDERKPFDASSAPRRSPAAPDNTLRTPPPTRSDTKRPISSQVVPSPATVPVPVSAFSPPSGNPGSASSAWGQRKEVGTEPPPPLPTQPKATMWSASRLAQASAVEKVSSGRWQPRPPEGEAIRSQESEGLDRRIGEANRVMDDVYRDRQTERPRSVSSLVAYAEVKETTLPGYHTDRESDQERARSPVYPEMEKNVVGFSSEGISRPGSSDGRFGGSNLYQQGVMEVLERPKLTLLPRRKPLESPDIHARGFDSKQVYQTSVSLVQVKNVHEMHGSTNLPRPGPACAEEGSRAAERPRLNLRPRTQPIEQSDGNADRGRQTVFGGARPRELILKERGIDVASNDLEMTTPPNRARDDTPKNDSKIEPNATTQSRERSERLPLPAGQRTEKDLERRGYRPDSEKVDPHKGSWRNDYRKNSGGNEKPLEQPRSDTHTWRKPVEQPKPDIQALRSGKAASAMELAQAFSRSVSDAKLENDFTTLRSTPGQTQPPFSRLTNTRELYSGPAQRQINGY